MIERNNNQQYRFNHSIRWTMPQLEFSVYSYYMIYYYYYDKHKSALINNIIISKLYGFTILLFNTIIFRSF